MEKLAEFVTQHLEDDISRLVLNRDKWPDIDMDLAVNCIESRHKLRGKVKEWYNNPELIFPLKLSAEQCSSSATGRYKSALAERIARECGEEQWKIADLTGGLGVDSWFFSQKAVQVLYNEALKELCDAAEHNFKALGSANIEVSNHTVVPSSCNELLHGFKPDIIYMDPARRGEGGKKVFLIEECTPDVLKLEDELFGLCRNILIKLSPMADITMVCNRLGSTCREVHIVAANGECKELLIWMDREWNDEYTVTTAEINAEGEGETFQFKPSQEKESHATLCKIAGKQEGFLFEPGKALMKGGSFNLIGSRMGIEKVGTSTHYYISDDVSQVEHLRKFGKVFRICSISHLDKRSIRSVGTEYPYAEVTARNIPMDTDTLRKKLGIKSGDRFHIFGLRSDSEGPVLLVTEVMR